MVRLILVVIFAFAIGCSPVEQVVSPPEFRPEPVVSTPVVVELPELVAEEPVDSEPGPDEPQVDELFFDDLDTVKHSFWFRRNTTHTQPYLGFKREYIDGYGCIALGPKEGKYVYLTFDEGYEQGYTPFILDVLKEHNVPAAFFVTGQYARMHPALVKRMSGDGHIVANHTLTHPSLADLTVDELSQELLGLEEILQPLIGDRTYFMRPPMGQYSELSLAVAHSLGYRTVFWSMAYEDWYVDNQPGAAFAYEHVVNNIHPGAVILLHAVSESNTLALERMIVELRAQGYEFRSLVDFR